MKDKDFAFYQAIDTVRENKGYSNAQTLHKYVGREVIVGIREESKKNIFVYGILTCPDFAVCESDHDGKTYNPIVLNTEKITGLLVKITPTKITLPGCPKRDLSVEI